MSKLFMVAAAAAGWPLRDTHKIKQDAKKYQREVRRGRELRQPHHDPQGSDNPGS